MDQENNVSLNPTSNTPISDVLKNEQEGFQATPKVTTPESAGIEHKDSRILKTLEGDVAESVRKRNESLARMALAEEARRQHQQRETEYVSPLKRFSLYIVSFICIILGIGAIVGVQYVITKKQAPVNVPKDTSVIPTNAVIPIDITGKTYAQATTLVRNNLIGTSSQNQATGILKRLTFTYQTTDQNKKTVVNNVTTGQFINSFFPNVPAQLGRAFDGSYILGSESGASSTPFLILTTSTYDQAYAGLLDWENKMPTDLSSLFGLDTTATSTIFIDGIFKNRDIRYLPDASGNPRLVYGFFDQKTLVITTSYSTFGALYSRFLAGQFVQ